MNVRKLLGAYGLWLAGVLSAAGAAYFLYRSRLVSFELENEAYEDAGDAGLPDRFEGY